LPEGIEYSNAQLLTGGHDGLPVGDLNWNPELRAQYVWPSTVEPIITGIKENADRLPKDFQLEQNYPNPFNPSTTIAYSLSSAGYVKLAVYNVLGQKIKALVEGIQSAQSHKAQWDGTNEIGELMAAGIYYYKLEHKNSSFIKKMVMIR